ncbi:hypothetical protein D3C80_2202280 [compost metagenome]
MMTQALFGPVIAGLDLQELVNQPLDHFLDIQFGAQFSAGLGSADYRQQDATDLGAKY